MTRAAAFVVFSVTPLPRFPVFLPVFAALAAPALLAVTPWDQFRGPGGDGIVPEGAAPTRWSERENVTWRAPLPGKGWSSPVVAADGQIWLTTAIEEEASETESLALLRAAGVEERKFKELQTKKAVSLRALCVDFVSGRLLHDIELASIPSPAPIHHFNSYASPTPVLDGPRVICNFGAFGTFCLNRSDASLVWKAGIDLQHGVGPGSSPFIEDGKVILICDGTDQQFVAALDKDTGREVWRTPRPPMDAESGDRMKSFCTPIAITDAAGRRQLICMGAQWLVSLDPATGDEIWRFRHGTGFSVVPRPVYADGIVYVCTGYGKPQLRAVRVDGSGDVSETHAVWTEAKRIPAKPSPILHGADLFITDDSGIVSCFDAADGTLRWQERLGGNFTASPILAGGRLYFAGESGKVTLLEASASFTVIAENSVEGKIMASPAVVDGSLILRTEDALYRIDEPR
jgi:outer membrane protein assembly factor BamB